MGEAARDPRRQTLLRAQVRGDGGWAEAIVCNVSAHGLMLRGEELPRRGAFIEIASGPLIVAGQVRWALPGRCGVRTREAIDVAALLGEAGAPGPRPSVASAIVQFKQADRGPHIARTEGSARMVDLALTAALVATAAWLVGTTVLDGLGKPFGRVSSELAGGPPG
jgi:hypothetical protein